MPTQSELLEQARAASRLDPSGARSTVYGRANQVPGGILSPGTEPMPARSTSLPLPRQTANPAVRAAMAANQAVDPGIAERIRAGGAANPLSGQTGPAATIPAGPAAVAPAAPAGGIGQGSRISRAAMTANPAIDPGIAERIRAGGASNPFPPQAQAPAVGRASPSGPGPIQRAAGGARRAIGAGASGALEAAGTAARVASGVAGPMQIGAGVEQLGSARTAGDYAGGALRTGAGTLATIQAFAPQFAQRMLPKAGPYGAAAAVGMTLGDAVADPSLEWIRGNPTALQALNYARELVGSNPLEPLGQPPQPATADGQPPAPAAQPEQAATGRVDQPPTINPQSGDWQDINAQVRAGQPGMDSTRIQILQQELRNPNLTPQERQWVERELAMAQGAPAAGSPGRPAGGAAPRGMPAPNASGPIAAAAQRGQTGPSRPTFGQVGVAYGGDPGAIGGGGARAVYGMQLPPGYDPETAINVIRGNRESIAVPSPTGFGYSEWAKDAPVPQSDAPQDIARWAVDMQARGMGRATELIVEYLGNQERNRASLDVARMQAGSQDYATNMRGPATVTSERPVLDANGNPVFGVTRKQSHAYNPATGAWDAIGAETEGALPTVSAAAFDQAVADYAAMHKVSQEVAARVLGQYYRKGQ